ncbi:alpha/beta hydrolase [Parerythrobacter jejuensis]|uniref:Alpha/beta hydrolase n=1 Tax=Parerythrobacter jejuensis TaxID=795812 RepID=A0A845AMX7_9SPHN|nr:alpha/beta hydrolase [Parerythrobacter jejuensis]MXP30513.1 alpha/beta hydrolase [Parerythrobacter jejuensis]MXP33273.1 alpha/beta hydrolase [Parerythrobacter jejuensis]
MRALIAPILGFLTLLGSPAAAQGYVVQVTITEEWVEDTVPADSADRAIAFRRARTPTAIAAYGPFRVIDRNRAALVGVTGPATPAQFRAMLRDYPELARLDLIECPGTDDDRANLAVGRMIRAAGLETRVPTGGSVRSGAVELFLAGKTRTIEDGAEFAVHSWLDDRGFEADDYAADSPEHRTYLAYYQDMGMAADQARAFYDMTNSVPHNQALWLGAQDMRKWLGEVPAQASVQTSLAGAKASKPRLEYLDFAATSF